MTGKPAPKFKLGDAVRIVRLLDSATSRDLIGLVGEIVEIEDILSEIRRLQVNYDVKIGTSVHYMHEEELELNR